jgi:hypothetical protein
MECNKKLFQSIAEAKTRANQINIENQKTGDQTKMRAYKCEYCEGWHLTSMSDHEFKYKTNIEYRNMVNERAFVKREAEYWESHFKIDRDKILN